MPDVHIISLVCSIVTPLEEKFNIKVGVAPTGQTSPVTYYEFSEIPYDELETELDAVLTADGDVLVGN